MLNAPSHQTLQAWNVDVGVAVGVVECQVSMGTQLIEWWKDNSRLALLNLTYDGGSGRANEEEEEGSPSSFLKGIY